MISLKIVSHLGAAFLMTCFMGLSLPALAKPKDGHIVQGKGEITQTGSHTDIKQDSHFMATQWQNFNIAANESVEARQPSTNARLLIRVDSAAPTNIAGRYSSNGITILENRAGVQFSQGAIVNVGGLLATSAQIDESTLAGNQWRMSGIGGAVVNHGEITAGKGGAILAAVRVENTGTITAKEGDIALGAGSAFTIDFSANGLIGFEVSKAAGASLVNTGRVKAEGGVVRLTAREAQSLRANVVSVGGEIEATRLSRRGGVVYLSGGEEGISEVSASIKADEKIEVTSEKYVVVKSGASLTAPEILVGGDFQGTGDTATAQRTLIEPDALLDAGQGGRVIVWSDEKTWFYGELRAEGGFAEISGKKILAYVNFDGIHLGEDGTLLIDPYDIIIGTDGTDNSELAFVAENDGCLQDPCAASENFHISVAAIRGRSNIILSASHDIYINEDINKPRSSFHFLQLRAGNDIWVNSSINVENGLIFLTAGTHPTTGTGIIHFASNVTLTGYTITLTQYGAAFGAEGPTLATTSSGNRPVAGVTIGNFSNDSQTVHPWMMTSFHNTNLNIRSAGDIIVNNDIILDDFHFGNDILRLEAGIERFPGSERNTGVIRFAPGITISAEGITLIQDGDVFGAEGPTLVQKSCTSCNNIFDLDGDSNRTEIRYDGSPSLTQTIHPWMAAQQGNELIITARGNINISEDFNAGNNRLTLRAGEGATGTGIFEFTPGTILQAKKIVLIQDGDVFGPAGPTLMPGDAGVEIRYESSSHLSQTLHPWMVIENKNILLSSHGGIEVNGDIDIGVGNLSLETDFGALTFAGTSTITANSIKLISLFAPEYTPDMSLQAKKIVLIQTGDVFSPTGPTLIPGEAGVEIRYEGSRLSQTLHPWMAIDGKKTLLSSHGGIEVNGDVDVGEGDLSLNTDFGALTFADASTITGNNIKLIGFLAPVASNANLTVNASGTLTIRTDINTGTGRLALRAGYGLGTGIIEFSPESTLTGKRIVLVQNGGVFGPAGPNLVPGNGGVVIRYEGSSSLTQTLHPWMAFDGKRTALVSHGGIAVNDDIDAGAKNLTLMAGYGSGTGIIEFSPGLTLTGKRILLSQSGDVFSAAGPTLVPGEDGAVIRYEGSPSLTQTLHPWMAIDGKRTVLVSHGGIAVNDDIDAGAKNLALRAGYGSGTGIIEFSPGLTLTGKRILLSQSGDVFSAAGPTLVPGEGAVVIRYEGSSSLTQTLHPWMAIDGKRTVLVSHGGIAVNDDIDAGTKNIVLRAGYGTGTGIIEFSPGLTLTGKKIVMSQSSSVFSAAGPTLVPGGGGVVINSSSLTQTFHPTLHPWMVIKNKNFLLSSRGSIAVNDNIDTGTGNLIIRAGSGDGVGALIFTGERTLTGGNITLDSDLGSPASNANLRIKASGNLKISAHLDAGTGDIFLMAGHGPRTGVIEFSPDVILSGKKIVLLQDGDVFGAVGPALIETSMLGYDGGVVIRYEGSSSLTQTVYPWMIAKDKNFTLRANGGIMVQGDLNTGTGNFILTAGAKGNIGAINFSESNHVHISGADIKFNASAAPSEPTNEVSRSIAITATGDIFINSDLHVNRQSSLRIKAGNATDNKRAINFSTTQNINITAGHLLLAAAGTPSVSILPSGKAITIDSYNLKISASIDAGDGDIILESEARFRTHFLFGDEFGHAVEVVLKGKNISLSSAYRGNNQAASGPLTIEASGNLNINASLKVDGGRLSLTAGSGGGSGALQFSDEKTIYLLSNGGDISLKGNAAPRTSNKNLIVKTNGALAINTSIDAGSGDLILESQSTFGRDFLFGAEFGRSAEVVLKGKNITLSSAYTGSNPAASGPVTIEASGNLNINASLKAYRGHISLTAGSGGGSGALQFSDEKKIYLLSNDGDISLNGNAAPRASNKSLIVQTRGSININTDINTGSAGNLVLYSITSNGVINFSTDRAITLIGKNIGLFAGTYDIPEVASNQNLSIIAANHVTIIATINLGSGIFVLYTDDDSYTLRGQILANQFDKRFSCSVCIAPYF